MKELNRGTRTYILATYAAALGILLFVLRYGTLTFNTEFLTLALIGASTESPSSKRPEPSPWAM